MAKKTTALAGPAELLDVDPASLAVEDQVRFDATPDDELVASVKRFGVLQPPTVYYDADRDAHVVVIGHRRVGAAIAAGAKSITVLVRPAEAAEDALRTEQQIVENERRKSITPGELAAGFKRLHLFGLTPQDIAAQVGEKPERIKAALAATESAYGQSALDKGVDLMQAAIIAEFDDDPDTQAELTSVALNRPESFRSRVAQVQAGRATDARIAKLRADAEQEGVKVVDVKHYDDRYWTGASESGWHGRQLTALDINPEEHTDCPGHAVIINAASWADGARLDYVCTDYKANGHEIPEAAPRELTEEEIAEREEREAARAAEEQRRQAFQANTTARREWLRGFLGGRLNQTAGIFDLIADATIGLAVLDDADQWTAAGIALQLLTGDTDRPQGAQDTALAELVRTGEVTPLRALAAYAIGMCDSWAETTDDAQGTPRLTAAYLERLQSWKYPPTDLDKEILTAAHEAAAALDAAVADDVADEDIADEPES